MKRIARTRLACLVALAVAASRACAHGNDFEMIVAITLEIAKNPKEPGLLLERAEVYRAHGDLATARRDIQAALDIKPDFHPARVRLALVARDEGQLEESLRLLGLVVEAQPKQPLARSVRSEVLRRLNRHAEAVADLDAILANPDVEPIPQLYLDKARSQLAMPSPETNAVIAGIDKGLGRLGPVPSMLMLALELEEQSGRLDDALRRMDALIKDAPRKEFWLDRRGDILLRAGRKGDALKTFGEAISRIDALPERQRLTVATTELRASIEAKLAPLKPTGKTSTP